MTTAKGKFLVLVQCVANVVEATASFYPIYISQLSDEMLRARLKRWKIPQLKTERCIYEMEKHNC